MLGHLEPETDWFPLLNRYFPSRLKFWDAVVRARERTGRHGPAMRRGAVKCLSVLARKPLGSLFFSITGGFHHAP